MTTISIDGAPEQQDRTVPTYADAAALERLYRQAADLQAAVERLTWAARAGLNEGADEDVPSAAGVHWLDAAQAWRLRDCAHHVGYCAEAILKETTELEQLAEEFFRESENEQIRRRTHA